jgi:hypothetical protein
LAPHLRRWLFDLDRLKGAGDKARRGLSVLRSFVGGIELEMAFTLPFFDPFMWRAMPRFEP